MTEKLDKILISYPACKAELDAFRKQMITAGRFGGYDSDENKAVVDIIQNVAENGDKALAEYTSKFDNVDLTPEQFRIGQSELDAAHAATDPDLLASLRKAIENVRDYQSKLFIGEDSDISGPAGIRYTPLRRVGLCIPGAAAPLPSTVIMTAVPALVAGVQQIAVVSPPRHNGTIHPVILATCRELELTEVYRIGGAQAVAALAAGTETIPKVDKIVGPGNKWVTTAKKNVSGDYVGIDSLAGPSEVLIIASDRANAAWVAADMLSQAEHGADSSAIVLTNSPDKAAEILAELKKQLADLPRAAEASSSLLSASRIIVVSNMAQAVALADDFASEHLEIQCGRDSRAIAESISNAGAIFIGPHTPVAVGDYWAGPSHTLPTGGGARFASALTSNDFVKSISMIEYTPEQLAQSADHIIRLAQTEGLTAHANSIKIRQQD